MELLLMAAMGNPKAVIRKVKQVINLNEKADAGDVGAIVVAVVTKAVVMGAIKVGEVRAAVAVHRPLNDTRGAQQFFFYDAMLFDAM